MRRDSEWVRNKTVTRFWPTALLLALGTVALSRADEAPPDSTGPTGSAESAVVASADDAVETEEPQQVEPSGKTARPRARNIPLDEPVVMPPPEPGRPALVEPGEPVPENLASPDIVDGGETFVLLDVEVPPATATRLAWSPSDSLDALAVSTPVLVVNGARPGLTLCLTAAVHGDELNGVEVVRRVMYDLKPDKLTGTVVGVPIVNLQSFRRGTRYLPDRRDLNRYFPGNPRGSSASRIAYSFFHEVIQFCDALVDLHTGSFYRSNLPQLRADLSNPSVLELTREFGDMVTLHSRNQRGTLRQAAVQSGIPAVTLEAGEPMTLQEEAVEQGVGAIRSLLDNLHMYKSGAFWKNTETAYYKSTWVRADVGGILLSKVSLGDVVDKGDTLGSVTDPITNVRSKIKAPYDGRVLGMALNQVVLPGFAAYRIGIRSSVEEAAAVPDGAAPDMSGDEPDPAADTDAQDGVPNVPEVYEEPELDAS